MVVAVQSFQTEPLKQNCAATRFFKLINGPRPERIEDLLSEQQGYQSTAMTVNSLSIGP